MIEKISQIPEYWDPHKKLEFVKLAIRSAIIAENAARNRFINREKIGIEQELEIARNELDYAYKSNNSIKIEELNITIDKLCNELEPLLKMESKRLAFRAKQT